MTPRLLPPRLLPRRILALLIDLAVAMAVVTALFLPFTDRGLRLPAAPFTIRSASCTPVETAPGWLSDMLGEPGAYSLRLCHNTLYGLPNGHELRVLLPEAEGAARTARRLVVPVDAALEPVTQRHWGLSATLLLLLAGSALLAMRDLPTPGKALTSLRIVPKGRPLLRETLRVGPLLLIALLPALTGGMGLTAFGPLAVLGIVAAVALVLTWYYLWPFAHWTGQSRHDRIAGSAVTHKSRHNSAGPSPGA